MDTRERDDPQREVRGVERVLRPSREVGRFDMLDEIRERVGRFERALVAIAAYKPAGALMTTEDEDRAAWVADAIERFTAQQQTARVKLPSPPVVMAGAPGAPSPRPRRPRRRRKPAAEGAAPRPRGRPRKTPPPAEG